MRYCVFCGVEIPSDAKFCQICGKEQPEDADSVLFGYETEAEEQGADKFLSSPKKMILAGAGIFVVLIVVVTTVIIFMLKK
jgi:uncharacterized membrane protein YvbJ